MQILHFSAMKTTNLLANNHFEVKRLFPQKSNYILDTYLSTYHLFFKHKAVTNRHVSLNLDPFISSFAGKCKCLAGYKGKHCELPCDRGRYGIGCSYRCNCAHSNADGCDPITGKCTCKPGWKGNFSEKRTDF